MKRSKVMIGLLASFALVLSACSSSSSGSKAGTGSSASNGGASASSTSAGGDIVVGLSVSLSGGTADLGSATRDGSELALAEYQAKKGKLADRIKLVTYDDQVKPETAVQNVTKLIKNDHAVIVLGPCNSGNASATEPLYAQNKIVDFVNCATGVPYLWAKDAVEKTPNPWLFRIAMSDLYQVPTILNGAKTAGIKKIAVLYDTTGYGVFGRDELKRRAKDFGIEIVAEQSLKLGDTDMTVQVQKAKDAGAEAVVDYTLAPELAQTLKSLDKLGWYPAFYAPWTATEPTMFKLAGSDIIKKFPKLYVVNAFTKDNSPAAADFYNKFSAKYGTSTDDWNAAAQAYDTMNLVIQVLEKVGPDSQKIRDALETWTGFKGVTDVHDFSTQSHEALREGSMFLGVLQPDGSITKAK